MEIQKLVCNYPYYKFVLDNYDSETLNNAMDVYIVESKKLFIDSCTNGNLFEVLRLLKFMGKMNINDGMLWATSRGHLPIVQALIKSKVVSLKTIQKCVVLCDQYSKPKIKEYLLSLEKNYNTHII